jgi:hypothetical protein
MNKKSFLAAAQQYQMTNCFHATTRQRSDNMKNEKRQMIKEPNHFSYFSILLDSRGSGNDIVIFLCAFASLRVYQ